MSNYSPIIGSAQHDVNDIRSILVTLRDNGKQGVIPVMYKEYEPTFSSLPDSTVDRWHDLSDRCSISVLPGQDTIDSIRSECHHVVLSGPIELVKCPEERNQGAKRFLDGCTTYMKTLVQLASRSNHKVLGFRTTECINSLGNMWEYIKNFHVPHPIRNDATFTVSMLRDHL